MQPKCLLVPCLNNTSSRLFFAKANYLSCVWPTYLLKVLQPSCFHLTKGHSAKLLYANLKQVFLRPYYNGRDDKLFFVNKPQVLQPSCYHLTRSCFHLTKGHAAKLLYANMKQVLILQYYNGRDDKLFLLTNHRCSSLAATTLLAAMQRSCLCLIYSLPLAASTWLKAMHLSCFSLS